MKVTLRTDNGTWIVKANRMTYFFTNPAEAFNFIEVCHKGVK